MGGHGTNMTNLNDTLKDNKKAVITEMNIRRESKIKVMGGF